MAAATGMKETNKDVFRFVQANEGNNITALDIANGLGLGIKQVNGIITASFVRHKDEDGNIVPLMERGDKINVKIDGIDKTIRYITLTEEGKAFDIDNA